MLDFETIDSIEDQPVLTIDDVLELDIEIEMAEEEINRIGHTMRDSKTALSLLQNMRNSIATNGISLEMLSVVDPSQTLVKLGVFASYESISENDQDTVLEKLDEKIEGALEGLHVLARKLLTRLSGMMQRLLARVKFYTTRVTMLNDYITGNDFDEERFGQTKIKTLDAKTATKVAGTLGTLYKAINGFSHQADIKALEAFLKKSIKMDEDTINKESRAILDKVLATNQQLIKTITSDADIRQLLGIKIVMEEGEVGTFAPGKRTLKLTKATAKDHGYSVGSATKLVADARSNLIQRRYSGSITKITTLNTKVYHRLVVVEEKLFSFTRAERKRLNSIAEIIDSLYTELNNLWYLTQVSIKSSNILLQAAFGLKAAFKKSEK